MKEGKNLSILPLFFIVLLDMIGIGIIIPILGPLFIEPSYGMLPGAPLAARTIMLGFLISSYPLAQFFGAPILGALSDKHGRKKLLMASLIGTGIGYILFGFGIMEKNLSLLFFSRALAGFTGGNISIAMSSIADLSNEKEKAKNFGIMGMAFGFGFIIGPYIGGKLSDPRIAGWFDFSTPLWFAAMLSLINIIMLMLVFRETLRTKAKAEISLLTGFRNIKKAFDLQNLRVIFVVILLLGLGFNFFAQFFQVYLIEKFSLNQSQIGDVFAFMGLWIAITQGIITRLVAKKFAPKQVLSFSVICLSAAFLLLLVPSQSLYLLFVLPFVAIFQGLTFPNYNAIVSNLAGKDSQGEALGITQSMQSLSQSITPIVAGFIVSMSMSLPLIVASSITLIAWLVFIIFFGRKKEQKFHEI